jgi:transformation/transcription domain-associated protein
MCAKLLNTIIDSVHSKGDPAEATRIMRSMFFSSLEKLMAMTEAYDRLKALSMRDKGKGKAKEVGQDGDVSMEDASGDDKQIYGWRDIEQAMPVHAVAYAHESFEAFCRGQSGRFVNFVCC